MRLDCGDEQMRYLYVDPMEVMKRQQVLSSGLAGAVPACDSSKNIPKHNIEPLSMFAPFTYIDVGVVYLRQAKIDDE